jgi:hypothetical protein
MKKLLIASIVMLASLTACQNSNDEMISTPVGKEKIEKSNKVTAREGEDLPPLSPEEEKAMIEDAKETLRLNREAELNGLGEVTGRRSVILCHTNYNSDFGHACVWNNGYLVSVSWEPEWISGTLGNSGFYNTENIEFTGTVVPRCNC